MFIKNGSFKKLKYIISYVPPVILEQPVGGSVFFGSPFTFKIKAKGSEPVTYQWYKNGFSILNAKSNTFTISSVSAVDDAVYHCRVTNNKYGIASDRVKLSVYAAPEIVQQPQSIIVTEGSNISFLISAVGTEPISYQWYKNSTSITESTSSTLYINNVVKTTPLDQYYAVITNNVGSITSQVASVSVYDPVEILEITPNSVYDLNETRILYAIYSGSQPVSGEWFKDGISLSGVQLTDDPEYFIYEIENVELSSSGIYHCKMYNMVNSVTSNEIRIDVNEPPYFITNPESIFTLASSDITFTTEAGGTYPISYNWIRQSDGMQNLSDNRYLDIFNAQLENQDYYAVIVSNMAGSITSEYVSLSVINPII